MTTPPSTTAYNAPWCAKCGHQAPGSTSFIGGHYYHPECVPLAASPSPEPDSDWSSYIDELNTLCEKHGCAAGTNRLEWLDQALSANAETRLDAEMADALKGMIGLIQLIDHRHLPFGSQDLKQNHRYVEAVRVLESRVGLDAPNRRESNLQAVTAGETAPSFAEPDSQPEDVAALVEHAELVMGNERVSVAGCKMVMRRMAATITRLAQERDLRLTTADRDVLLARVNAAEQALAAEKAAREQAERLLPASIKRLEEYASIIATREEELHKATVRIAYLESQLSEADKQTEKLEAIVDANVEWTDIEPLQERSE